MGIKTYNSKFLRSNRASVVLLLLILIALDFLLLQLRKDPDNPYDPDAIAVYNGNDHLGYIPKRDIPAIVLNMEDDSLTAEIDYVDEENVDLVVPVTFERILAMSDDDLEGFRFYKTERTKYETGYQESKSPITKEEFVEGIRQQKHQYV